MSKSNPTKAQSHYSMCLSQTPILSSHHGLPPSHQLSPPTPTTTEFLPPPRLTFSKLKLSYIHLHSKQTKERKKERTQQKQKEKERKSYSGQWSGVDGKRRGENGNGGEPKMRVALGHSECFWVSDFRFVIVFFFNGEICT